MSEFMYSKSPGSAAMNALVGCVLDTRRKFQAAWAASHQPARKPMRGSGEGAAEFCADTAGQRMATEARRMRDSRWVNTMFSARARAINVRLDGVAVETQLLGSAWRRKFGQPSAPPAPAVPSARRTHA